MWGIVPSFAAHRTVLSLTEKGVENGRVGLLVGLGNDAHLANCPFLVQLTRGAMTTCPLLRGPVPDPLLVRVWHLVVLSLDRKTRPVSMHP